jgi:ribonuclease PH
MTRHDGRSPEDLREISFELGFIEHHHGSVLTSFGKTRVLVAATVEERVPPFRKESGGGWLTAEYDMLPASTHERRRRAASKGKQDGRSIEIQRLIGRSLRNVVNIDKLGPRTIQIDCDVLQADGGTRTASITGAWVALRRCVERLKRDGKLPGSIDDVITGQVAAVSLGLKGGQVLVDLDYVEDSSCDTDMNLVGRADGSFIEVQGTAEGAPMHREELDKIIDEGSRALQALCAKQRQALGMA